MEQGSVPFIDVRAQWAAYGTEIMAAIEPVLAAGTYIGGPPVVAAEQRLAELTGAKHAIACGSGTDALMLALMAIGLRPGDEVITSPFTFVATANSVKILGGVPVFADIEPGSLNIDPARIEEKITSKTRAILPVSLYGQCPDFDAIHRIARAHKLVVIEDAAQSFGATYRGKPSCAVSELACTSFYPSKPLSVCGEGGAVFTSNDEWASRIRMLLNHGQSEQYNCREVGFNGRFDTIQAVILGVKLKHFPAELERRKAKAKVYDSLLNDQKGLVLPGSGGESSRALYTVRMKNRDKAQAALQAKGIPTRVYYPIPLHRQEPFRQKGEFPVAETAAREVLSLPFCAFIPEERQQLIAEALRAAT